MRVAYAVGRRVGPAVVRNRVRRRLRAVMADLARSEHGVPAGTYLLGVQPEVVPLSYQELRSIVRAALERLGEQRS